MKKGININIQKKDLFLLGAVMVFLVGVSFVIAYNVNGIGGVPSVMGHSADELEVNISGAIMTLQEAISQGSLGGMKFGSWIDVTVEASGGSVQGPAATDGFVIAYQSNVGPIKGFTPDSRQVLQDGDGDAGGGQGTHITMPVKRGDTWKVTSGQAGMNVFWISIVGGSSNSKIDSSDCYEAVQPGSTYNYDYGCNFAEDYVLVSSYGDYYGAHHLKCCKVV